ncbi:MAG: class I tRNA ligase family protein, partial [Planctomycetaceae bacterium]|nr:class I tRNA ligase family protein [Planctomycetaceae bacterium]
LGDTAVAVHPDPEAALDRAIDELHKRIATASEKDKADLQAELDAIERRKTDGTLARLKALAEMAKAGRKVLLPLMNREIPLVLDEWAKPEKGTGCVKITPAHDPNDYEVAVRQGLPMLNILNKDGTLNENAGVYAGLTMRKAREKVVADLEQLGLLVKVEKREIELAHSDRSKTPIEPFLNDQWFVRMEELAQSAMDAVEELRITNYELRDNDKIKIIPSRYTKGYLDWLSEKRDWPIGRQLWWGHRIPIWYCPAKKTADGRRQMAEEGATEDDLKRIFAGRDDIAWQLDSENSVWWICSQTEDLPSELPATSFTLVQEEDVLDTWFSSALWPHSTLGWPDRTAEMEYYYPTSVLITSRDIISLWVARMVLSGLYNTGQKPFHEVYIHPKILDKYGEGMSKSKGNGIDPISVMDKFGADALRFALAYLTTESQDVCLPLDFECPHCGEIVEQTKKNRVLPKIPCPKCKKEFGTQWAKTDEDKVLPPGAVVGERFEVARNFCNKLWNAARFVLMSTKEPERSATSKEPERSETSKEPDVERSATSGSLAEELLLEDRWIFSRLATVTKHVTESLESYRFAEAMRVLYDFAWDEFCSFYVEMVKPRLGGEHHYDAYVTLTSVLDSLLQLLHPVIPFVTEEIWQRLREFDDSRPVSITIAPWPTAYTMWINPAVESQFKKFQEVLRAVRDVRAKQNVPPKTEVSFAVKCDEATAALLKPMEQYFLSMAKAKATAWGPGTQSPALGATVPLSGGMDVYVDLTGLIDVEAERKKLDKEIANLTKFIQSKESKLSNEAFTAKAPADVIAKETESLRDLKSQLKTALEALERVTKNENPLF